MLRDLLFEREEEIDQLTQEKNDYDEMLQVCFNYTTVTLSEFTGSVALS